MFACGYPTGGGKTLIACHATGLAIHELLRADRAVVLWLVPSNTILNQTVIFAGTPPSLSSGFGVSCGNVEVLTMMKLYIYHVLAVDGQTIVIVSTIQSFRVEDTTGRQVYSENGAFSEHLQNLSPVK